MRHNNTTWNTLKPIFYRKLRLPWLPNPNDIDTKSMKCTWPQHEGTQRDLYSTWLHWACVGSMGLRVGSVRIPVGSTRLFRYQHVGIVNAKVSYLGEYPMQGHNTRGFVLRWNIDFKPIFHCNAKPFALGVCVRQT